MFFVTSHVNYYFCAQETVKRKTLIETQTLDKENEKKKASLLQQIVENENENE